MKFDKTDFVFLLICWGLIFTLLLYALSIEAQEIGYKERQVKTYIIKYFDGLYPKRMKRSVSLIPVIIEAGEKYKIDPLLLAVVISHESSWRVDAVGKHNEKGLCQIKNWPRKLTPRENIFRGAALLREYLDRCGTLLQALSAYQSGQCKPVLKSAERRWRRYHEAVLEYFDR